MLKPIDFERFYKAVSKVQEKFRNHCKEDVSLKKEDFIFLKTDGKHKFSKVFLDDILYVEGLKNYVSVYVKNRRIITYSTLKNISENLPNTSFIQTHKSYIISIKHIDKIDNDSIWINEKELPIGNTYRKLFFETIANNKL